MQDLVQHSPLLTQGQDLPPPVLDWQETLEDLDLFLPHEQPFRFDACVGSCSKENK